MKDNYTPEFKAGDFVRFQLSDIQLVVLGVGSDHYLLRSRNGLLKEYFFERFAGINWLVRWDGGTASAELVKDALYTWEALCPDLQEIYSQALQELSQYGRAEDRYYCKRLDRYVSVYEISIVQVLELVLWELEVARDADHAFLLVTENYRTEYDRRTWDRYVALIEEHTQLV